MKKLNLGICFILVGSVCFNILQYSMNNSLKSTISVYEKELNSFEEILENDQNTIFDDEDKDDIDYTQWYLKEVPSLYLHAYFGEVDDEWYSAAGPEAIINPYGANTSGFRDADGNIKVLEGGNEYFTKISIEGYVPTWYLTQNDGDINFEDINEEKYIIKETDAYYGADENSGLVKSLTKGTAIEIIGEYNDWYYIDLLSEYSSFYPEVWVKKDSVGLLLVSDSLIDVEVRVEEGIEGLFEERKERPPYIFKYDSIGRIMDEDDMYYAVNFPGTLILYIEKDDVQFMGQ